MITGVSGLPHFEEKSLYAASEEDKLGRDAFMKLFLAQMNHQDPLNPMDTTQFSSQLAQFSTLEQLFNVNTNLESIEGIQSSDSRYQALNLIGKEVEAESDTLVLEDGKGAKGAFNTEETAAGCFVRIYEDGKAIRDINMIGPSGALASGNHSFVWDGFDDQGNVHKSGYFTYKVSAVSPSGDTISVDKYIRGTITKVNMNEDEPVMYIDKTPLTMSQLVNINLNENEAVTE